MKTLFRFNVNQTNIVEEAIEKEIDGKLTKVLEKVEKSVPVVYAIKKPNRSDYEEAELFYSIQFSDDVRAGILTRSEIIKRFANEDTTIKKVYEDYTSKENELQRLSLQDKSPENIEKKTRLENELLSILVDIQNFELNKSSVFEHTAENRARNKTIFWWVLNLAYKVDNDKETLLFDGKDFKERIKSYDVVAEKEDPHTQEAIQKFLYFVSAWYTGQLNKEEEFKKAEGLLNVEIQKNKEELEKQAKELKEQELKEKENKENSPPEENK